MFTLNRTPPSVTSTDAGGGLVQHDPGPQIEALFAARVDIAALVHPFGGQDLLQRLGDQVAAGVHTQRLTLDDGEISVAVHDQAGEEIALGVDDAVGRRLGPDQRIAQGQRCAQPLGEEARVLPPHPAMRRCARRSANVGCSSRAPGTGARRSICRTGPGRRISSDALDGPREDPGCPWRMGLSRPIFR